MVPPYVTYECIVGDAIDPVKVDLTHAFVQKAKNILETVTGKQVLYTYSGGSLPVVSFIDQELHIPLVLLPLANEDCSAHGVNENFDIALLERSMAFSSAFFSV